MKTRAKKVHLMLRSGPFAFCCMRLKDKPKMLQTFEAEKATCKRCLDRFGKVLNAIIEVKK